VSALERAVDELRRAGLPVQVMKYMPLAEVVGSVYTPLGMQVCSGGTPNSIYLRPSNRDEVSIETDIEWVIPASELPHDVQSQRRLFDEIAKYLPPQCDKNNIGYHVHDCVVPTKIAEKYDAGKIGTVLDGRTGYAYTLDPDYYSIHVHVYCKCKPEEAPSVVRELAKLSRVKRYRSE